MKKSLIALAALTAVAGTASAQSSVTLSGRVDLSLRSVSAGGVSQKQMGSDGLQSSNLAFRGVEDLGGGLRAGFWLEAGLDASVGNAGAGNGNYNASATNTGAAAAGPGAFFNRRATASLIGNFGEIRLGRDLTPTFMTFTSFDPFGTNGAGSATNLIEGANPLGTGAQTFVRSNNTVNYFLPGGLGGLYGHLAVAAFDGTAAGLPGGNAYRAVRLGYAAGPLNVSFSTGKTTNGTGGADYTHNGFGGSFAMGAARVMAQYNKMSGTIGGRGATNWLIGGVVTMGATDFRASYHKTDGKGDTGWNKDATQIAAGAIHHLSKRTALYGTFSRISNSNNGAFSHVATVPSRAAGKSTAYEAGVRHNF